MPRRLDGMFAMPVQAILQPPRFGRSFGKKKLSLSGVVVWCCLLRVAPAAPWQTKDTASAEAEPLVPAAGYLRVKGGHAADLVIQTPITGSM